MESQKWSQFLVHASIVCLGLALEMFYPVVKVALCNPIAPLILPGKQHKSDELTAQIGIGLSLEPVLKQIETNVTNYESWGDYPEDLHPLLG
jgi:hypothetical protein